MRLSDFTPRINGIIPIASSIRYGTHGVGSLGSAGVANLINQDLIGWVNYPGGPAGTPAQFQAAVLGDAQAYCTTWPDQCAGIDVAGLVANAVAQYSAWYSGQPIQSPTDQQLAPPPGYQYNVYTGALEPIPNALTVNAPPPPQPPTTNQTSGTALTPPTTTPFPVTAQQVANTQTQSGSTALANGTSGSNAPLPAENWFMQDSLISPIPNWMLLAGGAVAVLMMVKK